MIPVEIGLIDIGDETMREAAGVLLPEYALNEPDMTVIGAWADDRVLAGALAYAPADEGMYRIHWIEVLPDYRRGGIGLVLMDVLTSYLAESEDKPMLTIWYDDGDKAAGFEDYLDATRLFEINDEKTGKKNVHIALWTGETQESMEAGAEDAIDV